MRPERASVAFRGGGIILTMQTPYDRQLVADYVADCARVKQDVRLTIGRETWRVEQVQGALGQCCDHCGRPFHEARCRGGHAQRSECVACAVRQAPQ